MILSVVIVNWNTGALLTGCLGSIYDDLETSRIAFEDVEIWVVDNCSTDGSVEIATQQYPQVKIIQNSTNPGFGAANNQAIRLADGDFTLLINPDTRVYPGALETLLEFLKSNQQAGAAGPRLLNPDGTLQYSCSPEPSLAREFFRLFHFKNVRADGYEPMENWDLTTSRPVDVLLGACILVPQDVLKAIGGFDERFFMYSEEVDLCSKIRAHGFGVYWVPTAQVMHYGGQSTRLAAADMFLQLYRSKIIYFRQHYGKWQARWYKAILLAAALPRVMAGWFAPLGKVERRKQQIEMATNYRRLITSLPRM